MDNVFCSGSEARLVDCPHVGSESENCGHFEDAGVRCKCLSVCLSFTILSVRLCLDVSRDCIQKSA